MPRQMRVMWYINPNDGPYPWAPEGRITPDLMRSRRIAVRLDQLGYYGTLVVGRNPLIETASWIPITEKLRYLVPIYPGVTPVAFMVQQAMLFDSVSNGRLLINQVNGTDQIVRPFGITVPSDERYAMSAEYWTVFKKLYAGEINAWQGKYLTVGPPPENRAPVAGGGIHVQDPYTPVWGSGASPDGVRHAGDVLDVYLSYVNPPRVLEQQFSEARAIAARRGRTLGAGILCNIIVRKTEAEAWAHAQWVLEKTGAKQIVRQIEARLRSGRYNAATDTRDEALFDSLQSDDPKIKARLDALRAGKLPDLRALESYPNIWMGPNSWGALDVLDQGWGGYFVGSAENVAARMRELQAKQGIDAFILAGWPSSEECERCAELLFPLLDMDREPPKMRLAAQ